MPRDERQPDDELASEPRALAVRGHRPAMEKNQALNDRETQAKAGRAIPLLLYERLENSRQCFFLDSHTIVDDAQFNLAIGRMARDAYFAARRRVASGIVE